MITGGSSFEDVAQTADGLFGLGGQEDDSMLGRVRRRQDDLMGPSQPLPQPEFAGPPEIQTPQVPSPPLTLPPASGQGAAPPLMLGGQGYVVPQLPDEGGALTPEQLLALQQQQMTNPLRSASPQDTHVQRILAALEQGDGGTFAG